MVRAVSLVFRLQRPSTGAIILEIATLVLSAAMVLLCVSQWRSKPGARVRAQGMLVVCLISVAVYYGVLVVWLLRWNAAGA